MAVVKATLVVLFFMHVKYGDRLNWVVVGAGVFWLFILLSMLMLDYSSRGWMNVPPIQHVSVGPSPRQLEISHGASSRGRTSRDQ